MLKLQGGSKRSSQTLKFYRKINSEQIISINMGRKILKNLALKISEIIILNCY